MTKQRQCILCGHSARCFLHFNAYQTTTTYGQRDARHQHHHRSTSPSCTASRQSPCASTPKRRQLALVRGGAQCEKEKQPGHCCTHLDIHPHPGRGPAPALHPEPVCYYGCTIPHLAADPGRVRGIPSPPLAIPAPSNPSQRRRAW